MKIVFLIDYDIVNYKKPNMFIGFPCCTFKCNKDAGKIVCQNYELRNAETIDVSKEEIVKIYLDNELTSAIVFGGLEPFDSFDDMCELIDEFRKYTNDDIVIYSGYEENEIKEKTDYLGEKYTNIIVKFGRFVPNRKKHMDSLLGVKLYEEQYSKLLPIVY